MLDLDMYYLTDFILNSWRQVVWSIRQNGDILAKGNCNISEVCQTIKEAKVHIPTEEEIKEKQRIKQKKYKEYKKRLFQKAKEKKEIK